MRAARPVILALFVASSFHSVVQAQEDFEIVSATLLVDPLTGEYIEVTDSGPAERESLTWQWLVEIVELVRSDPDAAALDAADWWRCPFDMLRAPPTQFAKEAEELEKFLLSFVRTSTNDWLVDRIAFSLAECFEDAWSPLFLDLLEHSSVQLRWRAVKHFAQAKSPDAVWALNALWNEELPNWIRIDLVDALLQNGSVEHAEDCVDLVHADDLGLARAALRTLTRVRPRGALATVRRLATQDDSPLREEAVAALTTWPDDNEVMRLLIELSRSKQRTIRNSALAALSDFSQPEAVDRLVEVVSDPTAGTALRLDALRSVSDDDHPDLIRVLSEILDEPTTNDTMLLQQAAIQELSRLGVEASLRDPARADSTTTLALSCGSTFDSVATIQQPLDGNSVRCWAAPHLAGDPEDYERLEAGMPVDIHDHFQTGNEHWVQVDDGDCWIPFEQVDSAIGEWAEDPEWPFRSEFDVWLEELDSPMGEALLAAEMIRVFDIDQKVAAIQFGIDPDDREAVGRLAEIYVNDDSEMSYYVWDAMDDLESRYEHDQELVGRIVRALGE